MECQQVSPTLLLFSEDLSLALHEAYGDSVSGTVNCLQLINPYVIQPFFNLWKTKYLEKQNKSAKPVYSPDDVRLDSAYRKANWVQNN